MQESDLELIEKYILNMLDDAARSAFEERLKTDESLQKEMHTYKHAIESFRYSHTPDVSKRISAIENNIKKRESLKKTLQYFLFSMLAIMVVLYGYSYFMSTKIIKKQDPVKMKSQEEIIPYEKKEGKKMESINSGDSINVKPKIKHNETYRKHISNKKLYAMYFKPFTDRNLNAETRGNNYDILGSYYNTYTSEDFEKTIVIYNNLSQVLQENDNILFVKAVSLMATKNMEESGKILNSIIKNNSSRYVQQAEWFLALNYLHKNQVEKSKDILQGISKNKTHPYYNSSKELTEKLSF